MSFKTILTHVAAGEGGERGLCVAAQVADMFDAAIVGVGAETFDPISAADYGLADGAAVEAARRRVDADLPLTEQRFHDLTAGRRHLLWRAYEDYPHRALRLCARGADIITASRPRRGEGAAIAASPADLVLESGLPVLLAADGDAALVGESIVIGWKDAREARRAVADALPFLKRAAKVVIVAVGGGEEAALEDVMRRLARHGISARTETVRPGRMQTAEVLEDTAARHGADLIVVGAYGHPRVGEWALGGVTEDFIAACGRYLFMSH